MQAYKQLKDLLVKSHNLTATKSVVTYIHFPFVGTVYEVIQVIHLLLFEAKQKNQNVILLHNIYLEIIGAIHEVCMLRGGGGGRSS